MDSLSFSAFRTNLASTFDKVNDDQRPLLHAQARKVASEPWLVRR